MIDIGVAELAMDALEATALARRFELDLAEDGRPAPDRADRGLASPAGADERGRSSHAATCGLLTMSQSGSLASDYLRTELMQQRSAAEIEFMTRTSILERLSGPSATPCSSDRGRRRPRATWRRSTLLIDDYVGWFRYHPILRGVPPARAGHA